MSKNRQKKTRVVPRLETPRAAKKMKVEIEVSNIVGNFLEELSKEMGKEENLHTSPVEIYRKFVLGLSSERTLWTPERKPLTVRALVIFKKDVEKAFALAAKDILEKRNGVKIINQGS